MKRVKAPLQAKFDYDYYTTGAYDNYTERFRQEGLALAQRLAKTVKANPSWKVLDVGCGLGGVVLGFRDLGYEAWGTEISPYCLRHSPAKKWTTKADARRLPFPDQSFDLVVSIDVLYYLPKKEAKVAMAELARVSRKYFYLETIPRGSLESLQRVNPDRLRNPQYLMTRDEYKKILGQLGLTYQQSLERGGSRSYFSALFRKRAL